MSFSQTVLKYKKNKQLNLGRPHTSVCKHTYKYFIIIPSYAEYSYIKDTLKSIGMQDTKLLSELLVVIVINNAKDDTSVIKKNNHNTYSDLIYRGYPFEFIIVDCYSREHALDNHLAGVGIARKIGMDFALDYATEDSLLCSVDADTIICKDYLKTIVDEYKDKNFSSAVVNFKHQSINNPEIQKAIIIYESLLKKIANNIKKTGSPYGFVSMGSTMICSIQAYIAVGGMPPKKATEDFYFLQQLAKHDTIHFIKKVLVYPSARGEQRVYLGTGYRMKNIKSKNIFNDLYINPYAYVVLKEFYSLIERNWEKTPKEIISKVFIKDSKLGNCLENNNFVDTFNNIQTHSLSKLQFIKQFHKWFDNLKIYKFLKLYGNPD